MLFQRYDDSISLFIQILKAQVEFPWLVSTKGRLSNQYHLCSIIQNYTMSTCDITPHEILFNSNVNRQVLTRVNVNIKQSFMKVITISTQENKVCKI